ncbi:MAG: N-formylglutamate amidohydrolase [Pirellulaceae bacterium]
MSMVISCEHATNHIPAKYASLFEGAEAILASHRGWDPGSLTLGRWIAKAVSAPLFQTRVSRLLVEVNRSERHRHLFSRFSNVLDLSARNAVLEKYYFPYRQQVQGEIIRRIDQNKSVLHISVHTFTPILDGEQRNADIGLLYDPRRGGEREFCEIWRQSILRQRPDLRVRRNYPYLGKADGFTTSLRREFADDAYKGIELEVNQRWVARPSVWRSLCGAIADSLLHALRDVEKSPAFGLSLACPRE